MDQYDYLSMDAMGRAMYNAQQAAVARANESLCETLFGRVEAIRKHRHDYAISRIKKQPFFMPNAK